MKNNLSKINFALIGFVLFALALRTINLNQSLWLDEAIQAWVSSQLSFREIFTSYLPNDFNPPLLYIMTWSFAHVLGNSEWVLRLPSVLAGVGLIPLVWVFAGKKKVFGENFTQHSLIVSLAFLSTAPLLIYYSQEARMYSLATFGSTWAMLQFWYLCQKEKVENWDVFHFWLATGLMMFSHYMTWFLLPIQIIIYLLFKNPQHSKATFLKMFLPVSFWLLLIFPILFQQIQVGLGVSGSLPEWVALSQFSMKQLLLIPVKIFVGRLPVDFSLGFVLFFSYLSLLWLYIVSEGFEFSSLRNLKKWLEANKHFLFLASWLILPIGIAMVVSLKLAVFQYFRFLYIVPAFYLLTAYALMKLSGKKWYFCVTVFLLTNVVSSGLYLVKSEFHREDWKSLVGYISQRDLSSTVMILDPVKAPFWYYDRDQFQLVDYSQINTILDKDEFWIVKYAQPIFEPEDKTETALVEKHGYEIFEEKIFRGDLVLHFLKRKKLPI